MGRWPADARERLRRAAVELFVEQGFAATTVPQITERAGLTTRTFFRHFADKREVLFDGDEAPRLAARLVADVPAGVGPVELIATGLHTVAATRFDGRRDEVRVLRGIIRSDAGLAERDLRKRAALAAAMRAALLERGVDGPAAALLAETGVTVLFVAMDEWLDAERERPLGAFVDEALDALRGALARPAG
jgi:AcrR family transcriptional regulator